ncbi:MAG TPA: CarD family transcriptional regulator, partial [Geobacterales bacterium]|nr:CarD family transcriptional regulator [Geobacterales bacterium]
MTPPAVAINQIAHRLATDQQPLMVAGLNGSAPAFLLASMLASQSPPLLIITGDAEAAEELWREISFYRGGDPGLLLFPAWDVTPFEHASPHADIVGQRLSTLHRLQLKDFSAVIAPLAALTQRLLPLELIANAIENVTSGIELPRDNLLRTLVTLGYLPVPLVEDRGTFAIRGGILDLFPPDATAPVRIEFFGDFVESLRSFDPLSQRSLAPVEQVTLLPSREVILTAEVLERLAERLKERCDELGIPPLRRRELLEQLKNQNYPPGIEFLLPLIHPGLVTITDYLGDDFLTVLLDPAALEQAREEWKQELIHGEEQATARDDIIASANSLYLTDEEVQLLLTPKQRLLIPTLAVVEPGVEQIDIATASNSDLKLDLSTDREGVLRPLVERLQGWLDDHQRVIVACHQRNQAQRLLELLAHHELPLSISPAPFADELKRHDGRVDIILGPISRGFRSEADRLVVIAEEEIFGRRVKRRGVSELKKKQLLTSLLELKPGDYMVHIDHGIGIYRGLQHLNLSSAEGDFLLLEYAGGDRLYLPVDRLNLVSRYVGADGVEPRIDKLGGVAWEKAKGKAREAIEEMAQELLELYAARQVEKGYAFAPSDELYQEFEASFTYEETPDQQAAIDDVLADMESERPMDRLVCGDVGYG